MKRYGLYGLVIVGIVCFVGGVWWLLAQPIEGGHGPSFFISISIFLLVFAAISLRWMHETAAALLVQRPFGWFTTSGALSSPLYTSSTLKSLWLLWTGTSSG